MVRLWHGVGRGRGAGLVQRGRKSIETTRRESQRSRENKDKEEILFAWRRERKTREISIGKTQPKQEALKQIQLVTQDWIYGVPMNSNNDK